MPGETAMSKTWPSNFKYWVSGSANWGPLECYFNSSLTLRNVTGSTNATLTLLVRLCLERCDAKDVHKVKKSPQKPGLLRDWDKSKDEFRQFNDAVKAQVEKFWNVDNRLCLVNQLDVDTFDVQLGSTTIRPNVDCKLEIVWAESMASAHQIINCFCPNPGFDFSSHVQGDNEGNGVGQFANDLVQNRKNYLADAATCRREVGDPLDPLNMRVETYSCPKPVDQMGVAYEIGHLIGLPHVGVARRGHDCLAAMQTNPEEGSNAGVCYRGPTQHDAENIMGIGNNIDPWNLMPWQIRLFQHTGIGPHAWKPSHTIVPPKIV
jgi:hypothetical protein